MPYAYGEPVTLTLTKTDGTVAVLADYAEVVLTIVQPDGTSLTRTKTGSTLTANPYVFTPTQAGRHVYYYVTTTPNGASTPQPFDVEAAGAAGIVSLSEVKEALDITSTSNDTELQGMIDAATAVLVNHPGYRVADVVGSTSYTEWVDGGSGTIVLRHYPVTGNPTVTEYTPTAQVIAAEPLDTTSSFTGYGYQVDRTSGILTRTSGGLGTCWRGRVKVVYTAGSTVVPADVRQAALVLVDHLWQTQRGGVGTLPVGLDLTDETSAPAFGVGFTLPNRVRELLEPYTRTSAVA